MTSEKTVEERIELITRNTEEIISMDELKVLLQEDKKFKSYVGFEPSGLVHIGWQLVANKIKDLTEAGFEMTVFLADWHAYINDKYGSNIDNIRACAEYMKDCFISLGVDTSKTIFVYATELIDSKNYWERVLRIAKNASLARIRRAMTIMGRKEEEADTDSSKFIYPSMQAADIFELDVDIAYGGMDQRKAHMLARDVAEKLGWRKPIALHTPLLMSLTASERMDMTDAKMSKSDPDSCVYIHDSPEEIKRKLHNAYCPEGVVEENPVIDICNNIIFANQNTFTIERPDKFGGDLVLTGVRDLRDTFQDRLLHPLDLKNAVADYLAESLKPVREYFKTHPENYEKVKDLEISR
ncbi:tyrosine--tRNA ligase [[Eubacterium] cellulosolvens]